MITNTKFLFAASLILLLAGLAAAELEVTPYGVVHYRLRGDLQTASGNDTSASFLNYSNRLSWRGGARAKVGDQVSLQLQIGNDWILTEDVSWRANNLPGARAGGQNLYVHIASFKWNPGPLFLEAGVLPLVSNGTLDLLDASLSQGHYQRAGWWGWLTETNNSLIGLRVGVPIVQGDIKVGAELFQSIIEPRGKSYGSNDNPPSILLVLNTPVTAGALKVTPELTAVVNRNYNQATEAGDHEIIGGLSAAYKVNDGLTVGAQGGYGTVSNEASEVGRYGAGIYTAVPAEDVAQYKSNAVFLSANASLKAGPGTALLEVKYNSAANSFNDDTKNATARDYFFTDLRYSWKPHANIAVIPRYRTYFVSHPENVGTWNSELLHRFEVMLEGSF